MAIIEKITARTAGVGVIGLGYVGLPLALAFAEAGFHSTGFDIDPEKIRLLKQGRSYISYISGDRIAALYDGSVEASGRDEAVMKAEGYR